MRHDVRNDEASAYAVCTHSNLARDQKKPRLSEAVVRSCQSLLRRREATRPARPRPSSASDPGSGTLFSGIESSSSAWHGPAALQPYAAISPNIRRIWRGDAAKRYFRALADEVFAGELAGCDIPSLILLGEHDSTYTPALMADTLLRWMPDVRLEVLPACGHFPMLELPLLLAAQLERFFTAPQ